MAGPFTATVEVAGPFRIEGKPCTMAATRPPAATAEESAKSRNRIVVLVIGIIAVAAAGFAVYKKKAAV